MVFLRKLSRVIAEDLTLRPAIVVTGARQTGKTTLLQEEFGKFDFVSLDLPAVADEAEKSGETFLARFKRPLIIDEVQYAPGLFRYLKHEIDTHRKDTGRFILSGSHKLALMQNISETLAGRIAVHSLYPFSLEEIAAHTKKKLRREQILDFLWRGGYPEVHTKKIHPSRFYADYTATYIERDLRQIVNVRDLRQFNRFMRLCASRVGSLISASALAIDTGITVNTAQAWLSALETSGIVILLPPYFKNFGKRVVKASKLYFADTGLAAFLVGIPSLEQLMGLSMVGAFFENMVVAEAVKRLSFVGSERNLYFYRDHHGREVDLIYAQGNSIHLAECKFVERPDLTVPGFNELEKLAAPHILSKTILTPAHPPIPAKGKSVAVSNVLDFGYWL
ncbi:MAG: ATP-binding protein [Spirochaetes bacterium]|nr:ATP-binding protein [Spirochaetota bacterium]